MTPNPRPAAVAGTRRRMRAVAASLAYWAAVIGLCGLNAWWWWDARPSPPLATLGRLVGGPRNAEAEAELRRIVRKSPHDGEALVLLARALASRGDTLGCAESMHRVPSWAPNKAEALYGEALSWMEIHHARRAEAAYLRYLEDDPNHPELSEKPRRIQVEQRLLDLYALENRWEEARALALRAHDAADPSRKPFWLQDSLRTHLVRSHPAAAIDDLRRFVRADPEDFEALRALARVEAELGLDDEADRHFAALLAARPRDPDAWRDRLEVLLESEDFDALERALAQAPPQADADGSIWLVRGQAREQASDLAAAAVAYRHAVTLRPFDLKAHYRLSLVAHRLGHEAESRAHSLRHAELERAQQDLREGLDAYNDAVEAASPRREAVQSAIARLVSACRGLGLPRDADAWAALLDKK